ncbi:multiple resistance and pH regulation protein F [candidate division KSB1 bacterium]|nr:multiple resistance and pH regulation protein F [candidate division KSB1 bacterium]
MKSVRWFLGLIILAALFYANFVVFQGDILAKLINVYLFSALFVLYRVLIGPSAADRLVAVDIFGILIVGLLAIIGLANENDFFMDIGLIWALLSFIASLAFAKILEGRSLDD